MKKKLTNSEIRSSFVKAAILFQFDHSKKQKLAKYYDYSPARQIWRQ